MKITIKNIFKNPKSQNFKKQIKITIKKPQKQKNLTILLIKKNKNKN